MSWDSYINVILADPFIHSAALIDLNDGSYWAYGGSEVPQPEEIPALLDYVKVPSQALKSGIIINGVKYFGLHHGCDGDSRYIIFKKGCAGGCGYTTNQLLICAVYGPDCKNIGSCSKGKEGQEPISSESLNPAECHATVRKLCTYLFKLGF